MLFANVVLVSELHILACNGFFSVGYLIYISSVLVLLLLHLISATQMRRAFFSLCLCSILVFVFLARFASLKAGSNVAGNVAGNVASNAGCFREEVDVFCRFISWAGVGVCCRGWSQGEG